MNYKMLFLTSLVLSLWSTSPVWAGILWADAISPECKIARVDYKDLRPLINKSCRDQRKTQTKAQKGCTKTPSGFNVWNPYCHLSCDTVFPQVIWDDPKKLEGIMAHQALCRAKSELESCRTEKKQLIKDLQDYVNTACCPNWWPCKP